MRFLSRKLLQFETSDIAIVEHAKHFPEWEFVRTMMPSNPTEFKNVSMMNIVDGKMLVKKAYNI